MINIRQEGDTLFLYQCSILKKLIGRYFTLDIYAINRTNERKSRPLLTTKVNKDDLTYFLSDNSRYLTHWRQ